jgi:hypothetical protein
MSNMSSLARGGFLVAAVALAPITTTPAKAQQFIPDIIISSTIPANGGDAVNMDATHPSEIVELTKSGKFVSQFNVDAGQGGAFGIGITLLDFITARLAMVDDNANDIIVIDQNVVPGN